MKSAVLFDLDNTLTHRQKSITQYSQCFARDFSHVLHQCDEEKIQEIISTTDNGGYLRKDSPYTSIKEAVADRLIQKLSWKIRPSHEELIEHRKIYFPASAVPMPGLYEVMEQLRQVSFLTGIVSNGSQESRQRTVQNLNLGKHIDILISSGEAGIKKPDARIFALALSRLGVQASAAWFVGDHPLNDTLGAQRAGLQAIWLKGFHEWPANVPGPAWEVDSLYEIIDIITQHHRQRSFRAKNMR